MAPSVFSTSIFFAIVGTRKPTSYGIQITKKFSRELVEAGFVIVSGMALGIDTIAHEETIENGGKTIAVLGSGVNVIYPSSNYRLYHRIIKTGGAVVSEFPPNQFVLKGLFISRNRIISGLSRGVLIAEGGEFSGALITAKYAGIQGKDVFAIPSPINSEMASAPNLLIKQGAKLVMSVEDILEELKDVLPEEFLNKKGQAELETVALSDLENKVFSVINNEPAHIDEIINITKIEAGPLATALINLEIKGFIKQFPGKMFVKM